MMNPLNDNLTVIIREANERTLPLCRDLVASQVDGDRIVIVSEVPFARALRKSYEIGIERDTPWTLMVDADVLFKEGAVEHLLRVAESVDSNVFMIMGKVLDKFVGGPRYAGVHLYRTAHLHKAITKIPLEKTVVRPESFTIRMMRSEGFDSLLLDAVVGLHDYEQYYCDIYRKALFHAHKHKSEIVGWENMWRSLSHSDGDYRIALKGAADGREHHGAVTSDLRLFHSIDFDRVLNSLDLREKSELPLGYWSPGDVAGIVLDHIPSSDYWAWKCSSRIYAEKRLGPWEKLGKIVAEKGLLRAVVWAIGSVTARCGKALRNWGYPQS